MTMQTVCAECLKANGHWTHCSMAARSVKVDMTADGLFGLGDSPDHDSAYWKERYETASAVIADMEARVDKVDKAHRDEVRELRARLECTEHELRLSRDCNRQLRARITLREALRRKVIDWLGGYS